eukprot:4943605-Pyramimonas_sp.AAC.1
MVIRSTSLPSHRPPCSPAELLLSYPLNNELRRGIVHAPTLGTPQERAQFCSADVAFHAWCYVAQPECSSYVLGDPCVPFSPPLDSPVTAYQGREKALELRRALRVRLEQSADFQRRHGFCALQTKALGDHEM